MLQQTRVAAALPYYERFLQHFPTVEALAQAPEDDVLCLWAGLGYYSRARNLQKAAQAVVEAHGGVFPSETEKALALPGIGEYTAAAILSIAYGEKLAVLDGNVARVIARLGAIRGDLRSDGSWQKLQVTADAFLAHEAPGDWNQAMMELGATVCTPKSPQCLLCPVNPFCEARKQGLQDAIPEKRKQRDFIDVRLAAAVLVDAEGRTLLLPPPTATARGATHIDLHPLLSRMWHFPTIAVVKEAPGELRRHLRKKLLRASGTALRFTAAKPVKHSVTYRNIVIQPFVARVEKLPKIEGAKWLPLDDLSSLAVSNLTRKVARAALESSPRQ